MRIRDYLPTDRAACLGVFDSNVPTSFLPAERPEFEAFLDALPGPYLVIEDADGMIVACGGYAVTPGTTVCDICWGMVALPLQGTGIGRMLTQARIERGVADPRVTALALRTSQHTRAFYEKLGFVTISVTPDGFAPGLDRCDMRLELGRG